MSRYMATFACLMMAVLPVVAQGQTKMGIEVGVQRHLCNNARWGILNLNNFPKSAVPVEMIPEGTLASLHAHYNFIDGSAQPGDSYLSLFVINNNETVVLQVEFMSAVRDDEYVRYRRELFRKAVRFNLTLKADRCAQFVKERSQVDQTFRIIIEKSLENSLKLFKVEHTEIRLCEFSPYDPDVIALVYKKGQSEPDIYSIGLYSSLNLTEISNLKVDDFFIGPAGIVPSLAVKACF